jgi:hypothetical protein
VITLPNVEEIRSAQSRSPQHLGQRLEYERARRFVGRDAELELFAARLAATRARASDADLFSVLWVHGPGGIGKSSLLEVTPGQLAELVSLWLTRMAGECHRVRPGSGRPPASRLPT